MVDVVGGIVPSVIPRSKRLLMVVIEAASCVASDGSRVPIVLMGVP